MLNRLKAVFLTAEARMSDDRGHVGVLMALVIFVVLGSLTMTWNTAQLSKEKMRLQNAADSAALGFCVWQARGMNTVQNLNDEAYTALLISTRLLKFAVAIEAVAKVCDGMTGIPFVGPVFWAAAQAFHVIAVITGGISGYLAQVVCKWILRPLGYFYVYGSTVLGHWGAQQLASMNLADPLGDFRVGGSWMGSFGIFAIGLALPVLDTVRLPLEQKDATDAPWKSSTDQSSVFTSAPGLYGSLHKFFKTGQTWEFKPWVSKTSGDGEKKKSQLPGPSIWIARKSSSRIEAMPLVAWAKSGKAGEVADGLSMYAIAAAQCVTGEVIAHSVKPKTKDGKKVVNQRPAGFGTGATAKLVPVSEALKQAGHDSMASFIGHVIYH